jgi:hypothetical protein
MMMMMMMVMIVMMMMMIRGGGGGEGTRWGVHTAMIAATIRPMADRRTWGAPAGSRGVNRGGER